MLTITARVMNGTSVVGYQLSDGVSTQLATKEQAWMYAKNKQIYNVIATGDQSNPGLSGTNGFELKKLPDITEDKLDYKYSQQDLIAAELRAIQKGIKAPSFNDNKDRVNWMKQLIQNDIQSGISLSNNLSRCITVENTLYNKFGKKDSIVVNRDTLGYSIIDIIQDIISVANSIGKRAESLGLKSFKAEDIAMTNDVKQKIQYMPEKIKIALKTVEQDVESEKYDRDTLEGVSNLLDYWENLFESFLSNQNILTDKLVECTDALVPYITLIKTACSELKSTQSIIGYRLKYTGPQPLTITRIALDNTDSQITIQPNESICLSRVEISLLGSRPDVQCLFANGKIEAGSKNRGLLQSCYFTFEIPDYAYNTNIRKPIQDFVDNETLKKYFIPSQSISPQLQAQQKHQHQAETTKKLNSAKSVKDIFKAF